MTSSAKHELLKDKALEELEFLMKTELLRATSDEAKKQLLQSMKRVRFKAGERFITQGETGACFYVIQSGLCVVSMEKGGQLHPISRLKAGEIVGEMAVLTGETRNAHVEAEEDVTLWEIGREAFDRTCEVCPDLREFLMELATERLCSQKITSDRTVGRYTINEIIAEGGWSIVYKGVHSFLKLPVAVKMLKHSMAGDSDFFTRFQNEAKIIAGLNHENIVRVYDIEHIFKTVFIVMEYLDGVTLKHVMETGPGMSVGSILEILLQVCAGLRYAHEQGIVHQDVKPGNIFIQKDKRVRLVDFGLACPIGVCSDDMPGTPHYMAPEQIEGDPVDPRTDIYSLGITAFEMATGQRPFPDDVCEVLKAHITQATPNPCSINPHLPVEFGRFVVRATEKRQEDRYESMATVTEELRMIAAKVGLEPQPQSPTRRRMMSLFMFYGEEHQLELNKLLEDFSEQMEALGAKLRVADFDDLW